MSKIKNYKLSNGIPKRLRVIMDKPLINSFSCLTEEIQNGEVSKAFYTLVEEIKRIHIGFCSGNESRVDIAIKSSQYIFQTLFPGDSDFT